MAPRGPCLRAVPVERAVRPGSTPMVVACCSRESRSDLETTCMSFPLHGVRDNSPAEIQAFEATCDRLAGFDQGIDFEWVDGYLAALAAGPRLPEPAQWLPLMCGDAFERAFADPPDAAQAERSLLLRLKVLRDQLDPQALMEDPESLRLNPLMVEWTDADRERLVREAALPEDDARAMQTGVLWAEGFLDAVETQPDLWQSPADDESAELLEALLAQVAALVIPPGHDDLAAHLAKYHPQRAPSREDLLAEACYSVQDLRVFWVDRAPKPETRHVEAAPGRNDPCPCGSGKKYKKCHGATA
jgi:uncharacterized protein